MAESRITQTGFKEWSSTIHALKNGDQICLARKDAKSANPFHLEHRRFWLFPTYAHDIEDLIQPRYRDNIEAAQEERQQLEPEQIMVHCWAEAKYLMRIRRNESLNWLTNYTIYSPQLMQEQFQMRPNERIYLLVVRVYNLPEPRVLDLGVGYVEQEEEEASEAESEELGLEDRNRRGSPRHRTRISLMGSEWAELKQRIPLVADQPAVSDQEFSERKEALREKFAREGGDRREPLLI